MAPLSHRKQAGGEDVVTSGIKSAAVQTEAVKRSKDAIQIQDVVAFVFLVPSCLWFIIVWVWHLSKDAEVLPGATGFGWFFRYLTFYGFTLQCTQLMVSVLAVCSRLAVKDMEKGPRLWLTNTADILSCAVFALANVVTAMFHIVSITQGPSAAVEGGEIERPPWLGQTVHNLNTAVAWGNLFLCPHSFSPAAEKLSCLLILFYSGWILICKHFNGQFPYPILNKLPYPWGFMGMAGVAVAIFIGIFRVGKLLKQYSFSPAGRLKKE